MSVHGDTVWRACAVYFGSSPDTQDAFQDVFLRYAAHDGSFSDEDHRKAWLIRVAVNRCKDMLKAAHRADDPLSAHPDIHARETCMDENHVLSPQRQVLDAMWDLDDPPRTQVYLALYMGYTAPEVAAMCDMPVNTVYSHIARGRARIREVLS